VLLAALAGALLADQGGDRLGLGVESASAASTIALQRLGSALPLGYAFGAGMAAAVNPCGFAMLPGYLALYLRNDQSSSPVPSRLVQISGAVTVSFVVLFGAIGLLLTLAGSLVGRLLPVASLTVGVLLVIAGARVLAGGAMYVSLGERLAGALTLRSSRRDLLGYAAYGLAYGLTSLSCTLPIFLTVVGASTVAGSRSLSVLAFVLYALGMAVVLAVATVAVAAVRASVLVRLRGAGRYLNVVAGSVLLVVGGYVVYYWLTLGRVLA